MKTELLHWPRRFVSHTLDLLYPPACPVCEQRLHPFEDVLCEPCRLAMLTPDTWRCPLCGATDVFDPPAPAQPCRYCPPDDAFWRGALAATHYRVPEVRRCVHLFKYQRRLHVGEVMGRMMIARLAEPLRALDGRIEWIVPVPLHWTRRMGRGFNQSHLLAKFLSQSLDLPVRRNVLRRTRATKMQTRVPPHQRARNVAGAFAVRPSLVGSLPGILLVDDVITSGHTINECARVLALAGAPQVWAASFARGGPAQDPADVPADVPAPAAAEL